MEALHVRVADDMERFHAVLASGARRWCSTSATRSSGQAGFRSKFLGAGSPQTAEKAVNLQPDMQKQLVPLERFELPTLSLRMTCSTPELQRRKLF